MIVVFQNYKNKSLKHMALLLQEVGCPVLYFAKRQVEPGIPPGKS